MNVAGSRRSRWFVVVAVGVLYLLETFDVLDASRAIDRTWPVTVIVFGVTQLAAGTRSLLGSLIVTGIGVLLLFDTTDVLEGGTWRYIWPIAVVAVGVSILLQRTGARPPARVADITAAGDDDDALPRPSSAGRSCARPRSASGRAR